jgi:hypothetical protein
MVEINRYLWKSCDNTRCNSSMRVKRAKRNPATRDAWTHLCVPSRTSCSIAHATERHRMQRQRALRVTSDGCPDNLAAAAAVAGCESTLINQSTRLHFSLVGGGCKYFGAEKLYY